jgi:hypothetical protein
MTVRILSVRSRRGGLDNMNGVNGFRCECLQILFLETESFFIIMLYRPARSETVLRFELKRNEFLNLRQQSLAFAEAPISDLLVSRQQSGGMGESMDVLTVDDDCVGQGKIRIFRYTFGQALIEKMGRATIGNSLFGYTGQTTPDG